MLLHHGQVEADPGKVRVRPRERHGESALRRSDVGEAVIVDLGEFCGDRIRRTEADAAHGLEKLGKDFRFAIDLVK